jgi:hypothetical protein
MLDEAAPRRIPQISNLFRFPTLKTFLKTNFIRPQSYSQITFPSYPSLIAVSSNVLGVPVASYYDYIGKLQESYVR